MSPYIVTTKRRDEDQPGVTVTRLLSRRAVATVEEAREAWDAATQAAGDATGIYDSTPDEMPESGGTISLPDGTVKVEAKTWGEVADASGWLDDHAPVITTAAERVAILAAFNAREATR